MCFNGVNSKLASVYHEMYQSIFDYKKEFQFYDKLLKKNGCKKILEIGCGSGNLASYFMKSGYNYTGLDLFSEMLRIAKQVEPKAKFVHGDMRNLRLRDKFDAVIVTGRSFTYLTKNEDVIKTLQSIHKTLKNRGILIFDNFDAQAIFGNFKRSFIQSSRYKNRLYRRISNSSWNLKTGWTWNWNAKYATWHKSNPDHKLFHNQMISSYWEARIKPLDHSRIIAGNFRFLLNFSLRKDNKTQNQTQNLNIIGKKFQAKLEIFLRYAEIALRGN